MITMQTNQQNQQGGEVFIGFAYKDVLHYFTIIHSAHRKGIVDYYNIDPKHTILTPAHYSIIDNMSGKEYNAVMLDNLLKKYAENNNIIFTDEKDLRNKFFIPEDINKNFNTIIKIWESLLNFKDAMQFVASFNKEKEVNNARIYVQTLFDHAKSGLIFTKSNINNPSKNTPGARKNFFIQSNNDEKGPLLISNDLTMVYKCTVAHISPILYQIDVYAKNTINTVIADIEKRIIFPEIMQTHQNHPED